MDAETKKKARYYSTTIRRRLGENVRRIVLFGSRARGDAHEGSDYDFLVIVHHSDALIRQQTISAGVDFLNKYDELAGSLVFDEQEWQKRQTLPIGINIEREGISL
jgi:predicted nucleotidyltransferase